MKDRCPPRRPRLRRMWVSTFHAFCARILRVHAEKLGYKREFTIYDGADQVRLVKRCIVELGKDPKRFNPRSFQAQISSAKNVLMAPMTSCATRKATSRRTSPKSTTLPEAPLREQRHGLRRPCMQTVALLELFPEVRERYQTRQVHPRRRVPGHQPRPVPPRQSSWQQHIVTYVSLVTTISACSKAPRSRWRRLDEAHRASNSGDEVRRATVKCDFRPATVTGVSRSHKSKGIRITTRSGRRLVSTPEHVHFAGYKLA